MKKALETIEDTTVLIVTASSNLMNNLIIKRFKKAVFY
mgnify:CR=1 FL=1